MFILNRSTFGLKPTRRFLCQKKDDEVLLFRGVSRYHPGFPNAKKGIVEPPSTLSPKNCGAVQKIDAAKDHNENRSQESLAAVGSQRVSWTSWTHSKDVAKLHAGDGGIVLSARLGPSTGTKFMWSPDEYFEQEVLVEGPVRNAIPELLPPKHQLPKE